MIVGNVKVEDPGVRASVPGDARDAVRVTHEQALWLADRRLEALSDRQLLDIGLFRCGVGVISARAKKDDEALPADPAQEARPSLNAPLRRVLALVGEWWKRAEERRVLASCDDFMLRDMGLTRCEVDFEIRKPFWRV